jgi:hypothetical protein
MYGLSNGGVERRLIAPVAWALLAIAVLWLGLRASEPQLARDFEACVEQVEAQRPPNDERRALMTDCNVRFAGRRKAGGGYTYYDFMQDRNFDIAGPNLTEEERKEIDREYMAFLDTQRREAMSAALAKRLNEQLRADLEGGRQPVGPPLVLTPKISSSSVARQAIDRSKSTRCEDGSLTCRWAKFSAAVKNAFASSSRTDP